VCSDAKGYSGGRFFIISAHREKNVDTPENLRDLLASLWALADEYGFPIIVSTHPRKRSDWRC